MEPGKCFSWFDGGIISGFHVLGPVMSIRGHVIIDIDEFGGVVGGHVVVGNGNSKVEVLVIQQEEVKFK